MIIKIKPVAWRINSLGYWFCARSRHSDDWGLGVTIEEAYAMHIAGGWLAVQRHLSKGSS